MRNALQAVSFIYGKLSSSTVFFKNKVLDQLDSRLEYITKSAFCLSKMRIKIKIEKD